MALFAVNTGYRDAEIGNLQWRWKIDVPQLDTAVFIIPGEQVKNGDDRLVVLNKNSVRYCEAAERKAPFSRLHF